MQGQLLGHLVLVMVTLWSQKVRKGSLILNCFIGIHDSFKLKDQNSKKHHLIDFYCYSSISA